MWTYDLCMTYAWRNVESTDRSIFDRCCLWTDLASSSRNSRRYITAKQSKHSFFWISFCGLRYPRHPQGLGDLWMCWESHTPRFVIGDGVSGAYRRSAWKRYEVTIPISIGTDDIMLMIQEHFRTFKSFTVQVNRENLENPGRTNNTTKCLSEIITIMFCTYAKYMQN